MSGEAAAPGRKTASLSEESSSSVWSENDKKGIKVLRLAKNQTEGIRRRFTRAGMPFGSKPLNRRIVQDWT
jgi:hypothetical protein